MAPLRRWRVPADADFRWRAWDGEFVLYHVNSGETHRLNSVAAEVLTLVEGRTASTDEVVRGVLNRLGLEADASLERQVEALLGRFHELGLIEPEDDPRRADSGAAG